MAVSSTVEKPVNRNGKLVMIGKLIIIHLKYFSDSDWLLLFSSDISKQVYAQFSNLLFEYLFSINFIYVRLKISVLRTKYINSLQLVYILSCETTVQIAIYEHVPREF